MARHWTFGRKLGAGFALIAALAMVSAVIAVFALKSVVSVKDEVITHHGQLLIDARALDAQMEHRVAAARAFLLTKEERHLANSRSAREGFRKLLGRLESLSTAEERRALSFVGQLETEHQQTLEEVLALRRSDLPLEAVVKAFDERVVPKRDSLRQNVEGLVALIERERDEAKQASTDTATAAMTVVTLIALATALGAAGLAVFLARTLGKQIGTAVGQVQSSSSELQAAANQQATGAREQATAMSEITTTISELLATSRQIAESAQRVAHIAEQTAGSARSGGSTVEKTQESLFAIRRQVDLVVGHMLELGKKSQQIGGILDIVSELAEQTNILAINATIEAAGAGEAGKRFAVVAEEIRKLADRVAGSTKEIRGLIDDVRGAVNTTVMATESGSKAVDAGARQFGEVASAFQQIASLVSTTMEASREIELSTKQQTTAVEQVNVAIANVAQATRETEASSSQTLQTAGQLAGLSKDLLRLVQPPAAA